MGKKVEIPEEQVSEAQEQVSEQLSQVGSQDEVLSAISDLTNQVRGLQGKQDKTDSTIEKMLESAGVELTPEQSKILRLEERLASADASVPVSTEAQPTESSSDIDYVATFKDVGILQPTAADYEKAKTFTDGNAMKNYFGEQQALKGESPPASPGQVSATPGGSNATVTSDDLNAEYETLMDTPEAFTEAGKKKRKELITEMKELDNQ